MGKIRESGGTKGGNRATPSEAASYIEEIDTLEQGRENRLDQLNAEYKKKARDLNKSVNSDIKAILADAKTQGVKKGVVRAIVDGNKRVRLAKEKLSAAENKAQDGIEALETEEHDYAIDIIEALGDDFANFGLGAAAVVSEKIAEHKAKQPDAAAMAEKMAKDEAEKKGKDKTSATVTSIKDAPLKPH